MLFYEQRKGLTLRGILAAREALNRSARPLGQRLALSGLPHSPGFRSLTVPVLGLYLGAVRSRWTCEDRSLDLRRSCPSYRIGFGELFLSLTLLICIPCGVPLGKEWLLRGSGEHYRHSPSAGLMEVSHAR